MLVKMRTGVSHNIRVGNYYTLASLINQRKQNDAASVWVYVICVCTHLNLSLFKELFQ